MSSLLAQYSSDGLSRNLREMSWGEIIILSVGLGGKKRKRPKICTGKLLKKRNPRKMFWGLFRYPPPLLFHKFWAAAELPKLAFGTI